MFSNLTAKLESIFKNLKGKGILNEEDVSNALKEIKIVLLEADVNFKVVKLFLDRVKEKAIGQEVLKSLTPGQQVVKIVWQEIQALMGEKGEKISLSSTPPTVIMLIGLQGSGKTTTAGKLALSFKREGKRVLLAAADIKRPAAIDQLISVGKSIDIEVYSDRSITDPVKVCTSAMERAKTQGYNILILDTAGRLHIDDELLLELQQIKERLSPHEILLVADAMTGQEAVNISERFNKSVGLTGAILTKLDGDARGGSVLSIRSATGVSIKYIGVGEKLDALEPFYPERMASRILGMGDVLTLIEKAEEAFSQDQRDDLAQKVKGGSFTLDDFGQQLRQIKKIGSIGSLLQMIPGIGKMLGKGMDMIPDKEIDHIEAIISSMTKKEKTDYRIIDGSRRKRIAKGSGRSVQDVNNLIKQFMQTKKIMKSLAGKEKYSFKEISQLIKR